MFALRQFTVYLNLTCEDDNGKPYTQSSSKKIFALDEASALRGVNEWIKESGYTEQRKYMVSAVAGTAHFDQDILYTEESLASIITYLTRPVEPTPGLPQPPSAQFEQRTV